MSKNVVNLTPKQLRAIESLLRCGTIAAAAKDCAINTRTLFRWLQDPDFSAAYRDARLRTVEAAISVLQSAMTAAVAALLRNLKCDNPHAEVRAAQIIIEQS